MRFVPLKTVDQQAILAWHSVREGWKEERTALLNRVRGLLAEFGVVIGRSSERLLTALPELTEDSRLPDAMRALLLEAREQFVALHARLARCDAQIAAHARNNPAAQCASELLGVGAVTASALAATVPDARVFKSGRQFGAWLGLVPRQHSSGGRTRLGRISLRGNVYLRTLLIQGARSTLQAAMNKEPARANRLQRWIIELYGRKGYYKTLIAIANKHARILWAMLAKGERYDASAWQRHPMNQPLLAGNN
jgi:transposase